MYAPMPGQSIVSNTVEPIPSGVNIPKNPKSMKGQNGIVGPGQVAVYSDQQSMFGTPGAGGTSSQYGGWQFPFPPPERMQTLDSMGNLLPQYQLDASGYMPNALELNRQNYQRSIDELNRNVASSVNSGMNQLASTGGLSSGARERLQRSGVNSGVTGRAGLAAGNVQNITNIDMQDYLNRLNANQFNITNALGQVNQKMGSDLDIFDIMAKAYGSEKIANAIANQEPPKSQIEQWSPGANILKKAIGYK